MSLAGRVFRRLAVSAGAVLLLVASVHALEVKFAPVVDGVHAYIGDMGPRSMENEGLNANIGLVVTPAGAVLIDSGATYRSASAIPASNWVAWCSSSSAATARTPPAT